MQCCLHDYIHPSQSNVTVESLVVVPRTRDKNLINFENYDYYFSPQNANHFSRCHSHSFIETVKQIVQKLFVLRKGRHSKRQLRYVFTEIWLRLSIFLITNFRVQNLGLVSDWKININIFAFLSVHSLLLRPYEAAFLCLISFCNCK